MMVNYDLNLGFTYCHFIPLAKGLLCFNVLREGNAFMLKPIIVRIFSIFIVIFEKSKYIWIAGELNGPMIASVCDT